MNRLFRLAGAFAVAVTLVTLVVCDLSVSGFGAWWDRHAMTTSVLSDLLVVGVAALIIDEVVAYRQRKDRALYVASQALIVYGQARQAYGAVLADPGDDSSPAGAPGELSQLASNLLVASPSLFDDPGSRSFLLEAHRLLGSLYAAVTGPSDRPDDPGRHDHLASQMSQLQAAFEPLVVRFPPEYQDLAARGAT